MEVTAVLHLRMPSLEGAPGQPVVASRSGVARGCLTPLLKAVWPEVVCVDLSRKMLDRASLGWRLQADAAHLPLPDQVAHVVAVGDAPLFAQELVRILVTEGVVLWVNALGADAPFYLATNMLVDAMTSASGAQWDAVSSEALWGSWVVMRRAH